MKMRTKIRICLCAILVISIFTYYLLSVYIFPERFPYDRVSDYDDTAPPSNDGSRSSLSKDAGHDVQNAPPSTNNLSPPHSNNASTGHPPSHLRCAPIPLKFPLTAPLLPCAWLSSLAPSCAQRLRARLMCKPKSVRMVYEWVSAAAPPAAYGFEDPCLARAVRKLCFLDGQDRVPNLSHHVLFGGHEIRNYTFIGILSAVRFLQPCMVLIHADVLPAGTFWDTLVRLIPHLIHVQRSAPREIFGRPVKVIEHMSDIARLEAVKKFGGVYQDTDYFLLNPLEDLRNYSVVMGTAIPKKNYANGIFMGKPAAEFLDVWYDSYHTFNDKEWANHSTMMPYQIHHQRPELPFHEVHTFVNPYFKNIKELFYDNFLDWKRLHGIHLYMRMFSVYFKGRFDQQNSSLGQVSRHILFGDSEACVFGSPLTHDVVRMNSTHLPII